ncbi:MAG TPA: Ig-like domain-containing protein [Microlunatus sp.]|nr:Ig-like domain-containing protein [Microlunatus sp.]
MKSVKKSPLTIAGALATVAVLALTSACGTAPAATGPGGQTSAGGGAKTSGSSNSPTPQAKPVVLSSNVDDGATKVTVDTLVNAKASDGTLKSVKLSYTGTDGKGQKISGAVKGTLNGAKTSWTAGDRLEPSSTYTLTMTGVAASDSTTTTTTSTFKTAALTLQQQTFPTLYPLKDSKVGVGMPAVLTFDVPVKDKKSIEKNLHVTTVPKQKGSWHWISSTEVRYRPASYWKPGTKVSVEADVNGVSAGGGVYGQNSTSTNFTVGRSMVIRINLRSDVGTVYRNGKKVRTIYVSGGKAGWTTRNGTKLIMSHEYNKKMTNEMIGATENYSLTVAYAMRITNSGEFLHSAPWNAAYFGRRNASHGCTGMSTADAAWLMNNTLIGDPVVFTGSDRGTDVSNGWGDWNLSFKQYEKGSAL